MSEENVEVVRRVYEGVNARLDVPRELFDPDYEFDNTELWPESWDLRLHRKLCASTGKRSRLTTSRSKS
jgi:hypothetical protein